MAGDVTNFTNARNPMACVLHDKTGQLIDSSNPLPMALDTAVTLDASITLGTIGIVGATGNRMAVNADGSINTTGGGAGGGGAVTVANGADVAAGSTTDPKNLATDTTAATHTALLKAISSLLQSPLGVTGTFWQATQPVSGTFWQATQPVSGTVAVSNFPASQAVTGTFFQATQPVSIASMPSTPVTGTFWQATQPVSGTFFQATQPVSLAALPALVAGSAIIGKIGIDQTTPGTTNAVYDTANKWGDPALRQSWTFSAVGIAGVTTEALLSSVASTANVAASAATSYTVPAGKTLRITSFHIDVFNTSTVASRGALTVRAVPAAGTLAASSPIVHRLVAQVIGAVSGNAAADDISLPEGFCLPAGSILGVSQLCLATTCTVSFCLTGYLY